MGSVGRSSSAIILGFFVSIMAATSSSDGECVYSIYVQTGPEIKAGTDSKISVTLGDKSGNSVKVPDLEAWGLMGKDHDYYERANLDVFSGRGPCMSSHPCRLNLTSDGSGRHHGWYRQYLEVAATGPHKLCNQTIFFVRQWLALDAPPYRLTSFLDGCSQILPEGSPRRLNPLVVTRNGRDASK